MQQKRQLRSAGPVKMGRIFGRKKQAAKVKQQQTTETTTTENNQSVHRRNVRIFALPVILLFNVVRFIAFQLWILLTMACRVSSHALPVRVKNTTSGTTLSPTGLVYRSSAEGSRPPTVAELRTSYPSAGTPPAVRSGIGCLGMLPPPEPAISKQKQHHRKAFEYISKALKLDEEDRVAHKGQAIELYMKGIEELNKGIAVDIGGEGDLWDRARCLQQKMQTNLLMAKDRLDVLALCPSSSIRAHRSSRRLDTLTHKSNTLPRATVHRNPSASGSSTPNISPKRSPQMLPRKHSQPSLNQTGCKENKSQRNFKNLRNVDKKLAHLIMNEIIDHGPHVQFSDIAGQETSKQALQEIVILPTLRPELFVGLRAPARGLLLFGPPGNGKTMLAKAVAYESSATFFGISAASLTSKYVGEGEKLVRALFAVAQEMQPSVIFIDEVDSLLSERREGEHEASRRLKTEFLLEFDGIHGSSKDCVLVMGATNRPQDLDDAVLRRFAKRIYVKMPEKETRIVVIERLLSKHNSPLTTEEIMELASLTEGYSSSDLTSLAKDAALGPIREFDADILKDIDVENVRGITLSDFLDSLKRIRRSVPMETLKQYEKWNEEFGDLTT